MAEWSKLSFSSLELLAHSVGCRFESCKRLLFFYLYSVSTNKKLSHPSSLWVWMRSCHTMVKSAVLPKTTSLCTSITVITLWLKWTRNWSVTQTHTFADPPSKSTDLSKRPPSLYKSRVLICQHLLQQARHFEMRHQASDFKYVTSRFSPLQPPLVVCGLLIPRATAVWL